ncbi:ribosome small subunit-dependent GTPase A [Streptomyces sp. NPDC059740]|uniref:ribosome small subunit-dependent GTPase A n=1 Tax=Streptomyces sp. NPDC059740 TaxID=3346926 RepID=UPI0036546829
MSSSALPVPSAPHPLARYGWDTHWEAAFAPHAGTGLVPGRVVRVDRGRIDAVVPAEDGVETVLADTALVATGDPMRVPCTGDWAVLDRANGPAGLVHSLLPRRTALVRSASSKRSEGQVLAANVDHAVVAVSLAVETDLGRVERFVALAWESGARPVVVLTKSDLVADAALDHLLDDVRGVTPGVQVLPVSARTGAGLDVLAALLAEGTGVLLGQSGAGKSTLANALLGRDVQEVRAARDSDGKGRHTTTTRDLLLLPAGGTLIDTPGLRGVGMWDAEEGLARTFADVAELAADCRFHDCSHQAEPGCAVLTAVAEGALPDRRLESYRKLVRENRWINAKTDVRQRAEIRREWKQKQAAGRAAADRKRGSRGRY